MPPHTAVGPSLRHLPVLVQTKEALGVVGPRLEVFLPLVLLPSTWTKYERKTANVLGSILPSTGQVRVDR